WSVCARSRRRCVRSGLRRGGRAEHLPTRRSSDLTPQAAARRAATGPPRIPTPVAGTDTTTLAEHAREDRGDAVVRNNLATRLFHAAVALSSFALLGTGLWLDSGPEGQPSLLAELLSTPDVEVHRLPGRVLGGL